jgi:hypothetical protein
MVWGTVEEFYPDASTFIPSVATVVIAWCDAFTSWVEDDSNEENADRVLEHLKGVGRLELNLEVFVHH